jgi:hypothetical protein
MQYSYGGISGPIFTSQQGYSTCHEARVAALAKLFKKWHKLFPSEPESAHEDMRVVREQVESSLQQPSLF